MEEKIVSVEESEVVFMYRIGYGRMVVRISLGIFIVFILIVWWESEFKDVFFGWILRYCSFI